MTSLPTQFLKDIPNFLPENQELFLQSLSQLPITSLRLNPLKKTLRLPYSPMCAVPWCPNGYYLSQRPSFTENPLFWAGAFYVQEASSMFLEQIFKHITTDKPLKILDLSAAPGGKSTHLLSLMNSQSLLVSNEIIKNRADILAENLARWGYTNYVVTQSSPESLGKLKDFFDVILVDAPCSGEGMFRKDKEAINEWSEENVLFCAKRQKDILTAILPALAPTGYLIYSTCTFNRQENEENLHWLCKNFDLQSVKIPISENWNITEIQEKGNYAYRFFPHILKGEGFFISCMQKKGKNPPKPQKIHKNIFQRLNSKEQSEFQRWVLPTHQEFFSYQNQFFLLNPEHTTWISYLAQFAYIRQTALKIGELKGKDFIPSSELALSPNVSKEVKSLELSEKEALQFLSKQDFQISLNEKSWYLARYQNLGLGWLKNLGSRFNNYYPSEWRIRRLFS
ncbi:methyltransferase RsmF C-terminal domain-like protein [Raineya orbicola]|jgi:16S rRNA C967 or C1407 C5-methylase (RsmB/RsmF family)/NOL1/NOP2/fmu family ribosome biogenesis protein|uniref:NOL1/NOP2/sun family n=1 Tax=Raineya orbicola TaxID=2016530 RepID=A0A2N3IAW3_9BACT|nr:methyltransferase domain-containing protein [Raineya orbicola]PKQ67398.1 NOL1/NOP2/sun family [Raineya orbicola]